MLLTVTSDLIASGSFTPLNKEADVIEHSLEMHMPYLRHVFHDHDVSIVPIVVGMLFENDRCVNILSELLTDPNTVAVVSSDFCHWGLRFRYTRYQAPGSPAISLSARTPHSAYENYPIYKSISDLDYAALSAITTDESVQHAADNFDEYIYQTRNTICGRNPISLLLHSLARMEEEFSSSLLYYEQSSACCEATDSSVSYASVVIKAKEA